MLKKDNKIAQAAIELAVFGAILIFILGTIVRTAVGNGYAQNENFKAMRMALLASWNSSKAANMSRTSASILFVEDRLSPDLNKYGSLDRSPNISQGSGTFSFEEMYPLSQTEVASNLPIMDIYINGQHFPFTTAAYVANRTITRPSCPSGGPYPPLTDGGTLTQAQCLQNQCLRNEREWAGGIVNASQFDNVIPVATLDSTTSATLTANGNAIFKALINAGLLATSGSGTGTSAVVTTAYTQMPTTFSITDPVTNQPDILTSQEIGQIQSILSAAQYPYKLFYTNEVNGTPQFVTTPPTSCVSNMTTSDALCSSLTVLDANGNSYTNSNGDMQYDLLRLGNYTFALGTDSSVDTQFPLGGPMRNYIAWQWAAVAATGATSIGLNASNNQYPQLDIDGRLQVVTVYSINQNADGTPTVSYEDPQGGDIDGTWNLASCGPKPGLENDAQIFTFTQSGTYLQILEGKLYNPETDQFVRSVNKKDTIDLIQREIQLSNNTGRFCNGSSPLATVGGDGVDPNPVEVCIAPSSGQSCFSSLQNFSSTCFDENDNMLFVRSRLQDQRGHFWMTDATGQLQVQ